MIVNKGSTMLVFIAVLAIVVAGCQRDVAAGIDDDKTTPSSADCRMEGSLGDPNTDYSLPLCKEEVPEREIVPEMTLEPITDELKVRAASSPYEEGGIIYPPADTDEAMLRLAEFTRFYDDNFWGYPLNFDQDTRVADRYPFFPDLECDFGSIRGEPTCRDHSDGQIYTMEDLEEWVPYVLNVDVMAAAAADEVTCYRICVTETGHLVGLLQDEMDDWLRQYCPGGQCGANAARFGYN